MFSSKEYLLAWLYCTALTVLLLMPGKQLDSYIGDAGKEGRDILFHGAMYFIGTFLFQYAAYVQTVQSKVGTSSLSRWHFHRREALGYYAFTMAHHGLVTECLQYFIPGRSFDFADLGADLSGVVAASLLSHVAFYARLKDFSVAPSKK